MRSPGREQQVPRPGGGDELAGFRHRKEAQVAKER